MDIKKLLSEEFQLAPAHASNIVDLIEDGNTIPFIARYRKEMHGGCDDQVLREFGDRLTYLTNLVKRKEEVRSSIESQEKWTDEIAAALDKAMTMTEVEDIYRPYKQKKNTRAMMAIKKGLEPLADVIWAQDEKGEDASVLAEQYINEELGVLTAEDAIAGAKDIIAERISDDADLRKSLREYIRATGFIIAKLDPKDPQNSKKSIYEGYAEFREKVGTIPSHRILALNRGEKDECLKVYIEVETDGALQKIRARFIQASPYSTIIEEAAADSYQRLIFPSVEREVRNDLTDTADEQAIKMFEVNLRPLLLQPPLKGKVILGFDPAYRTGCKIAVIDANGNVLDHTVIYPTPPRSMIKESAEVLTKLVTKHSVDVIAIGNGTASKESEIFVADFIKTAPRPVGYIVVNEAGASVYSASKLGAEEFPEYDVTTRSAVSIARRLMDPLAELIKIDVKSIGVGQYQHDMPQKRLSEVLEGVVEDCVNSVGVNLNTASVSLLAHVSGLNSGVAKNIVEYRKATPFKKRAQLKEVSKLGPKAFEQCAGFLRIPDGEDVLDNTSVHPESYAAARTLLEKYGFSAADIAGGNAAGLKEKVEAEGYKEVADSIGVGELTLRDIVAELLKPGRDIRDTLPPPVLRADLLDLKDLREGMEIAGTVRNVIDFGAFVDIGVHQDGLVHISEISHNFITHPSQALKVGDSVKVKVIAVDVEKQRINLSIKALLPAPERAPRPERRQGDNQRTGQDRGQRQGNKNNNQRSYTDRSQQNAPNRSDNSSKSLDDMLKDLQSKFKKH